MLDINPDKEVDCVSHFFISDTIPIFEGSILEKHKNLVIHNIFFNWYYCYISIFWEFACRV